MNNSVELLAQLSALLTENGIGVGRLTPRPRGGRLSGEPQQEVERTLDALKADGPANSSLIYGNGCFAVGRYSDAAAVFQRILAGDQRLMELLPRVELGSRSHVCLTLEHTPLIQIQSLCSSTGQAQG